MHIIDYIDHFIRFRLTDAVDLKLREMQNGRHDSSSDIYVVFVVGIADLVEKRLVQDRCKLCSDHIYLCLRERERQCEKCGSKRERGKREGREQWREREREREMEENGVGWNERKRILV